MTTYELVAVTQNRDSIVMKRKQNNF